VLAQALLPDADQSLSDKGFRLPLRLTATWVLNAVILAPQTDAEKAALLLELLPGCEEEATLNLVSAVLRGLDMHAFPALLSHWRTSMNDPLNPVYRGALSRFGWPALQAMAQDLSTHDPQRLRWVLIGIRKIYGGLCGSAMPAGVPDAPALERRITGNLFRYDRDDVATRNLGDSVVPLVAHEDAGVRERAIDCLAALGTRSHAGVVRSCLSSTVTSTRQTAIVALSKLSDRDSIPDLLLLLEDEQPSVQRAAVQALGALGATQARQQLTALVDDPGMGHGAISALGELADEESLGVLRTLTKSPDKKVARKAATALYGGVNAPAPFSETTRRRLAKVRGAHAEPSLHISVVAAIRNLSEVRPYPEVELTRLIGEVCADYSTTRRELVMGGAHGCGLMVRRDNVYELSDSGVAGGAFSTATRSKLEDLSLSIWWRSARAPMRSMINRLPRVNGFARAMPGWRSLARLQAVTGT